MIWIERGRAALGRALALRAMRAAALALCAAACMHARLPESRPLEPSERFEDLGNRPLPPNLRPRPPAPAPEKPLAEQGLPPGEAAWPLVARLELAAPRISTFLLHGTLPVPEGFSAEGPQPSLGVIDHDRERSIVPAQVEVVTRDPAGAPLVIELCARVSLAPGENGGTRVRYNIVSLMGDQQERKAPPFRSEERVEDLIDAASAAAFHLRCQDVYGNVYVADLHGNSLAQSFGSLRWTKNGPWIRQKRVAAVLMPLPGTRANKPLPHLMGVHAYVSEQSREGRVGLDLRIHNGLSSGAATPAAGEEPSGIVYWKSLELVLPAGWAVENLVADPYFGPARQESGLTVVPIVRENADGSLHMMAPMMQFQRRLVLTSEPSARPRQHPLVEGLAFPVAEGTLWSWSRPGRPAYFPQRSLLGHWDGYARSGAAGVAGLRAMLAQEYEGLAGCVQRGEPNHDDLVVGVLGWAHPWFNRYGGTTGGAGIQFFEGHEAAGAASAPGLAHIALVHQMNASRQDEAMWSRSGDPAGYELWVDRQADRVPVDFRTHGGVLPAPLRLPAHGGPPASEQVREVVARGLRPAYDQGQPYEANGEYPTSEQNLVSWAAHDGQHMVRYTKNTKALVWLANDSLAKDDLLLSAELFHFMLHESSGPTEGGITLRAYEEHAQRYPHQGAWLGRDHAWGIDAMCAAYASQPPAWREAHLAWFQRLARMLEAVALPSGILQRSTNPKVLGHSGYDTSQTFESEFLLHAMRCMNESVFRGVHEEDYRRLAALVRRGTDYLFFGPVWKQEPGRDPDGPLVGGPRTGFAVALTDGYAKPPFCVEAEWGRRYLPADGIASGPELFYGWPALEYAALLSQADEGEGLENRYLKRSLQYGAERADYQALLGSLWGGTVRRSSDTSSSWIGFVGYLESLLAR